MPAVADTSLTVTWDGQQLAGALLRKARPVLAQGVGIGFEKSAQYWDSAMQKRMGRGKGGIGQLGRRTGRLGRSLGWRVKRGQRLDKVRLALFTAGVPYARAQQFGATITPRRAPALTIPGPANLTAAGVPRQPHFGTWMAFAERKEGAQVAIVPSRRTPGNRVVLYRPRKGSAWKHYWTLAQRVVLPGPKTTGEESRLGFYETWAEQQSDRVEIIRAATQKVLNKAGLGREIKATSMRIV